MSQEHTRQQGVEEAPASTQEEGVAGPGAREANARAGDAYLRRSLAEPEDPTPKQRYEQVLGRVLGGELYDLVTKEASSDAIYDLIRQPVDDVLRSAGRLVRESAEDGNPVEQLIANQTSEELLAALRPMAEEFLQTAGGRRLADGLSESLEGSPRGAVLTLLLAATAAYAADMKLPELKARMGIGDSGWKVGATVQLGSLQHLAVQSIGLRLDYEGERVRAQFRGARLMNGAGEEAMDRLRPRLLEGDLGDEAQVDWLKADVTWKLREQIGGDLNFSNETLLSHGHVVSGRIGMGSSFNTGAGTTGTISVTHGYGESSAGLGVSFKMKMRENLTVEGRYDKQSGAWVGMVVRIPFGK